MYFSQCNNINLDSLNISGNRGFNGAGILARITENFTLTNSHISFGSVPMEGGGVDHASRDLALFTRCHCRREGVYVCVCVFGECVCVCVTSGECVFVSHHAVFVCSWI